MTRRYDLATTKVAQLLKDPDAVAIIERRFPGITRQPVTVMARGMMAAKALRMASDYVPEAELDEIRGELELL